MTTNSTVRKYYWPALILFLVVAYFSLFLKLDSAVVRQWDESLFALRAYQVASEGQLLFNFSEIDGGQPHTNGKPPLVTLIQAASFKLLGYNELALRLPIALFALATVLYLLYFFKRHLNAPFTGLLVGGVLLTTAGYVHNHAARTGDQDAALAFWLVLAVTNFYLYLKDTGKQRYLFFFALSIAAGFLTKSVVMLFTAPAWLLFAIYQKKLKFLLASRYTYMAIGLVLALIVSVYVGIEMMHSGYLKHVWEHEIGGRYSNVIHGHKGAWYYYLHQLWHFQFMPWILLLPVALVLLYKKRFAAMNDFIVLMFMVVACHLLVVSTAQTKLPWYLVGAMPFLAVIAGAALGNLLTLLWGGVSEKSENKALLATTLIVLVIWVYPAVSTYLRIVDQRPEHSEEYACELMKLVYSRYPDMNDYTILDGSFFTAPLFYMSVWNDHEGYSIKRTGKRSDGVFKVGDRILVCNSEYDQWLKERFVYKDIEKNDRCKFIELTGAVQFSGDTLSAEDDPESIL